MVSQSSPVVIWYSLASLTQGQEQTMGKGMNLLLYAWLSNQSLELSGFENKEDDI